MTPIRKGYAYITRGDKLLVFRHQDYPEAGIQVPGGTIEDPETPEQGTLREATEETNLVGLRVKRFLGDVLWDPNQYHQVNSSTYPINHRHFFHLAYDGDTPMEWLAGEENPSDGTMKKVFICYWVKLDDIPKIIADQGAFLPQLLQSFAL